MQIIEMLQRERESVEWMRHELASLEQQLKQAQKEGVPTPLTPSEPSHPFLVLLLMFIPSHSISTNTIDAVVATIVLKYSYFCSVVVVVFC